MAGDPELDGLRQIYETLKARRTKIASDTGTYIADMKSKGFIYEDECSKAADEIIAIQEKMDEIARIIEIARQRG